MRLFRQILAAGCVLAAIAFASLGHAAVAVNITNPDGSVTAYAKLGQVIYADPGFGAGNTQLRYFCFASAATFQTGGFGAVQNCPSLGANIVIPSGGLISSPTGPTETPENVFDGLATAAPGSPLAGGTIVP